MNAREKLNSGYLNGSLLIAGLIGLAGGSWVIFFGAAIVLTLSNISSGEIRPSSRPKRRR